MKDQVPKISPVSGELPPATLDHYKEAFSSYEDVTQKGCVCGSENIRNALADCGIVFSPQEFQDIVVPNAPSHCFSTGKQWKPVPFKSFIELLRKVQPLVPVREATVVVQDKVADSDAASPTFFSGSYGSKLKSGRRVSRRESNLRDTRLEKTRMLEKLQDLRERLADGLSALAQESVIKGSSAPPDHNEGGASVEVEANTAALESGEELLVQECITQLELMNLAPQPSELSSSDTSGVTSAAALVAYMDGLTTMLSSALTSELEWVEAYSAEDLIAQPNKGGDDKSSRMSYFFQPSDDPEQNTKRLQQELIELESFQFSTTGDFNRKQGTVAFKHRVKDFPFFMFPIDSVCTRLDALDELQEQYEKVLSGREFLLVPKCPDGRTCRFQDVPEHRLAYSHPCFSEEVPCPHRHRRLHMKVYSHPEDDNPDVEVQLKSLQRRIGVVELTGMELGDSGAQCLAFVLQQDRHREGKPMYQELHLGGNHVSPAGAISLLESCAHLSYIDLSGNVLGYKSVALMQTSAIGPALQSLLTKSDRLTSLNLSRNRLSDRDGRYITEGLKTNTTLRHLDLRKNELGATFGADMATALAENRDLKELLLGWNRLESTGSSALLQEMKTSSTLEVVDLSWTGISDDGARAVAEMIAGSQALRVLSVAHNNVGPEGATFISKSLVVNKTLQSLDLSFNPIGSRATSELIKDLKDNLSLEVIDLRCVKAGEEVTEDIKRLIKVREPKMQQQGVRMTILFSTSLVGGGGPGPKR